VRVAAQALGVATEPDLGDYFRLPRRDSKARVAELVEAGELIPVTVEGWAAPAYLWPDATAPRTLQARALLSPFDSLIWFRQRTERLFGFRYRIDRRAAVGVRRHAAARARSPGDRSDARLPLGLAVIGGLIALVVPAFTREANHFAASLPAIGDPLSRRLGHLTGSSPRTSSRRFSISSPTTRATRRRCLDRRRQLARASPRRLRQSSWSF
jgi:Winged helix DNA-binding domain